MQHSQEFKTLCDDVKTRIQEIDIDSTEQSLNAEEVDLLIDVREKEEFDEEYLPHSTHMSKGWIEARIHQLTDNKNAKIILYCGAGNRSALAADNLQKMGYTNVLSMTGGFKAWKAAGKPTSS